MRVCPVSRVNQSFTPCFGGAIAKKMPANITNGVVNKVKKIPLKNLLKSAAVLLSMLATAAGVLRSDMAKNVLNGIDCYYPELSDHSQPKINNPIPELPPKTDNGNLAVM